MAYPNLQTPPAPKHLKVLIPLWGLISLVSLTRGFTTSLKIEQSQDFKFVMNWLSTWISGLNPYHLPPGSVANYPPHTIVFLSPLAFIPEQSAAIIWGGLNLIIAAATGVLAIRIVKPFASRSSTLMFALLFLSWAGLRVGLGNGQFSLLVVFFGLLAVLIADTNWIASGIFLGLSLMKPHLGMAFFLWFVLTRRFKSAVAALGVALLGLVIFSLRIGKNPFQGAADFLFVLQFQFGGERFGAGVTELRPLLHFLVPHFVAAEVLNTVIIVGLLTLIVGFALHRDMRNSGQAEITILHLSCLWALLAVFHNSYDFVLMVVVMAGLYCEASSRTATRTSRYPQIIFWLIQMALVIDVAGVWWKLSKRIDFSGVIGQLLSHSDRILCALVFVLILNRMRLAWIAHRRGLVREQLLAGGEF